MSEENNDDALPNPAVKPRLYALQKRQHRPDAPNQTCLNGALGRGADEASQEPGQAPGLSKASYCHKTPPTEPAAPLLLMTYYEGASLVDLLAPQAAVALLPASTPAKRQKIGEWSQSSRQRLRRLIATLLIQAMDKALVLTLTYPAEFPPPEKFATYKNHLRVFGQGLRRRFPLCSGLWKLEFQERGAAHFHLLCFGLPHEELDTLRTWISARWYAIAHAGDKHLGSAGCQADPIKHHGGFINYLTKYLAKTDQTRPGDFTGRYWGVFARERLPLGQLHTLQLTPRQWARVRRLMRKMVEIYVTNSRWKLFFNDYNPRKPAPGPEYGIIIKGAQALGDRSWWQQLKSAFHGGCRRLHALQWMPGEWRDGDDGNPVWLEPQFAHSTASTRLVNHVRLPSRYKAHNNDHVRVQCCADAFIEAVRRGIERGLI